MFVYSSLFHHKYKGFDLTLPIINYNSPHNFYGAHVHYELMDYVQMTSIALGIIDGNSYALVHFLECFYFILDVTFTEFTYTPIFLPDYIGY